MNENFRKSGTLPTFVGRRVCLKELGVRPPYAVRLGTGLGMVAFVGVALSTYAAPAVNAVELKEGDVTLKITGAAGVQYGKGASRSKCFKSLQEGGSDACFGDKFDTKLYHVSTESKIENKWGDFSALSNSASVKFDLSRQVAEQKYGAVLELEVGTNKPKAAKQAALYAKGDWGELKAGSCSGPINTMQISAKSISGGSGGIGGSWKDWVHYGAVSAPPSGGGSDRYVLDDLFIAKPDMNYWSSYLSKSNKVVYYTPEVNGFELGVAYIPDVRIRGSAADATRGSKNVSKEGYKDVVEGGLSYSNKVGEFDVKGAAVLGIGKSQLADLHVDNGDYTVSTKNLLAYEVGAKVGYRGFFVAGSYANFGKSGTLVEGASNGGSATPFNINRQGPRGASYWNIGMAYYRDKFGVAFGHMRSKASGSPGQYAHLYRAEKSSGTPHNTPLTPNKFISYSIGAEYKVMPGVRVYSEVVRYKYTSKMPQVESNSGNVMMCGLALSF